MSVTELSIFHLNFLLARLIEAAPQTRDGKVFVDAPTYETEFTLDDPNIFMHFFLESRARLGPHLENGDYFGKYRANISPSLSLLDHDSYHGSVEAIADTPALALGRAILRSLYGYDDIPEVVVNSLPQEEQALDA